jgi:hypothetical protein
MAGALLTGSLVVGGFTMGLTGFSFALVTTGVLAFFHPLVAVVPAIALVSVVMHLLLIVENREAIGWELPRQVDLLHPLVLPWPVAAMVIGSFVLGHVDAHLLRRLLGGLIVLVTLMQWRSPARPSAATAAPPGTARLVSVGAGIGAGVLHGLFGIGGPPIVLYLMARRVEKRLFIAAFGLIILALELPRILVYSWHGYWKSEALGLSLGALPPSLAGFALGVLARRRISEERFGRVVMGILVLVGLALLVR